MPFFLIDRLCPHHNAPVELKQPIKVRVSGGRPNHMLYCDAEQIYTVGYRETNRIRQQFELSQAKDNAAYFVCDHMGRIL